MGLLQQILIYIQLRFKGVPHETAWTPHPISRIDVLILSIVAMLVLALAFSYHSANIEKELLLKTSRLNQSTNELNKQNKILVSMLNGSVIIDGRKVGFCQINAAGDCVH